MSGRSEILAKARAAETGDVQALGEIQAAKVLQAEGENVHFQTRPGGAERVPQTSSSAGRRERDEIIGREPQHVATTTSGR